MKQSIRHLLLLLAITVGTFGAVRAASDARTAPPVPTVPGVPDTPDTSTTPTGLTETSEPSKPSGPSGTSEASGPSGAWLRIRDAELSEGWLRSENAAGLTRFRLTKCSEAALFAVKENGDRKNWYESDDSFEFGVEAASYYRLSERIAVHGAVGYSRFAGKHMSGSCFIDPEQTPFDLVEFTTENAGNKRLETCRVTGGVGFDLSRRIALGARFDYTTASYSKHKDLRHVNSLMEMVVSPGLKVRIGRSLALGANYAYRRRVESLLLKIYGKTDQVYVSLLDYGAFFGKRETFGESGYTKQNETKPLFDEYHGGALQLDWRITPRMTFFNEFSVRQRKGSYGKPSPSTVVYSEHDGRDIAYRGVWNYDGGRHRHTLQLSGDSKRVDNRENIYTVQNEEIGRSYILYLGQTEVGSRVRQSVSARYTGQFGMTQGISAWRGVLDGGIDRRRITATNYPDYRHQELAWWHLRTSGERNILRGRNLCSFGMGIGYASGTGDPCTDGSYEEAGTSETLTRTLDDRLMQEYEYLTASRIDLAVNLGLSRRFGIRGARGIRGFADMEYAWSKAFDTEYLGRAVRHAVQLRVGCIF